MFDLFGAVQLGCTSYQWLRCKHGGHRPLISSPTTKNIQKLCWWTVGLFPASNIFNNPLVMTNIAIEMAIEIVDLPIKHGDFPSFFVNVYQREIPPQHWVPMLKHPPGGEEQTPSERHGQCTCHCANPKKGTVVFTQLPLQCWLNLGLIHWVFAANRALGPDVAK